MMTTVCFKNGILATDSALWDNGIHVGHIDKAWQLGDGTIVTGAGRAQDVAAVYQWIRNGSLKEDKPSIDDGTEIMHVMLDGTIMNYESNLSPYKWQPLHDFWSIGSGRSFALGAMRAGASAEKACRIACQYDDGSYEPIKIFRLGLISKVAA